MFDGLSKNDIFEVLGNTIKLSMFSSVIYLCIYLMK